MSATASRQMHRVLKLRVSEKDRRSFAEAASVTGLTVSAWARAVLLERAAEMRARKVIV
jgi:hypothetical protein